MKKTLLTGIYAITPDNLEKEKLYKKVNKLLQNGVRIIPVSYTHLTLPTILLV